MRAAGAGGSEPFEGSEAVKIARNRPESTATGDFRRRPDGSKGPDGTVIVNAFFLRGHACRSRWRWWWPPPRRSRRRSRRKAAARAPAAPARGADHGAASGGDARLPRRPLRRGAGEIPRRRRPGPRRPRRARRRRAGAGRSWVAPPRPSPPTRGRAAGARQRQPPTTGEALREAPIRRLLQSRAAGRDGPGPRRSAPARRSRAATRRPASRCSPAARRGRPTAAVWRRCGKCCASRARKRPRSSTRTTITRCRR